MGGGDDMYAGGPLEFSLSESGSSAESKGSVRLSYGG